MQITFLKKIILYPKQGLYKSSKKIKSKKTLRIKYRILFFDKKKVIKNSMRFLFYLFIAFFLF